MEGIAKKIHSNKEIFRNIVSQKLNRNVFVLEEVHRRHTIPKELSSEVIVGTQHYKSSNKKLSSLKSDANNTELIQRFKSSIPQSNHISDQNTDQNIGQKSSDHKRQTNQSNVTKTKPDSNQKS